MMIYIFFLLLDIGWWSIVQPYLNSALILFLVTYFLTRKKLRAETNKINSETNRVNNETNKISVEAKILHDEGEITLAKFYREEVEALTKRYDRLEDKFEEKTAQHEECERQIRDLEIKYQVLLEQNKLLLEKYNKLESLIRDK